MGDVLDCVMEAVAVLSAVVEDLAVLHAVDRGLGAGTDTAVLGVVGFPPASSDRPNRLRCGTTRPVM